MLTALIAVLIGTVCAIAVYLLFDFLRTLELERKFKEKMDGVNAGVDKIKVKGITGNLLFFAEKIGEYFKARKFSKFEKLSAEIKSNLDMLGRPYNSMDPYTFIGIQLLSSLGAMFLAVLLLDIYNIILLAAIGFGAFFIPLSLNRDKVKSRHKAIFRQLPDVLDMLTLMIEAGLDFNSALNKIIESEKGPLIDEFAISQQEVKLGKSRADAMLSMIERIKYTPLNTVINSISLAIRTGGSLAPTLRTLSVQFRTERSQLAEKMAAEAPIKLMGPLVLLIFPTIFIILFGPILLSFMNNG